MSTLQIVRQFPHEPARVFSALTDPVKMSQWFFCSEPGGTKVSNELRVGGKYVVEMPHGDETVVIHGVYLEIAPPKKLVFTWNSSRGVKDSKVTFELSPIPEGTKLVITHELPEDKIPEHREGWIVCFDNLETFLGGEISGSKMNNMAEPIVIERTFNAPVAQVWRALTDVNQMREWYFDLKEFKPEAGFEFEFVVDHEGRTYHHLCKVTEVIPPKKIAYTWRYKGEPGDSLVTFELFAEGDKTRLTLTHTGIETFPKTPAYARKNFEGGWTELIGSSLKKFVENTAESNS